VYRDDGGRSDGGQEELGTKAKIAGGAVAGVVLLLALGVAGRRALRRETMKVFGFVVKDEEAPANLDRMFMARFGDIARIEARGRVVQVTLKSGTVFDLNRLAASDFDDGVRVWDGGGVAVDLDSSRIQTIELLPAPGEGGTYVDDRRYGRVLVSWEAFERADFSDGGSGPAYGEFPPGRALTASVTTRDGRRLAGRLVYDLDESETTETLDSPREGVDYTVLFGLIAWIETAGCAEARAMGGCWCSARAGTGRSLSGAAEALDVAMKSRVGV
jgi:hypothetical protein